MKTSVIKLSGKIISNDALLKTAIQQICDWQKQSGQQVILVHGGGVYGDRWCEVFGFRVKKYHGLRSTPEEQLPVISGALAGYAHTKVLAACKTSVLNAVGLTPSSGDTLFSQLHPQHKVLGRVGIVSPGDMTLVKRLLSLGYTPVFHSLATDAQGECLNVNADDIATQLALGLEATELVLLSDVSGVKNAQQKVIEKLDASELSNLAASPFVGEGMVAKLQALTALAGSMLERVVITAIDQMPLSQKLIKSATLSSSALATQIQFKPVSKEAL